MERVLARNKRVFTMDLHAYCARVRAPCAFPWVQSLIMCKLSQLMTDPSISSNITSLNPL